MSNPCNLIYGGSAQSVRLIDEIPCCVACGYAISDHKQAKTELLPTKASSVERHEIPTAVSVKPVLKLIAAHRQKDERQYKSAALEVAEELRLNGKDELYLYVLAQLGETRSFEITD